MNEKFFSHFIIEKIMFCIIIQCNNIIDANVLSSGYPTKLKNYGNSKGDLMHFLLKVPYFKMVRT